MTADGILPSVSWNKEDAETAQAGGFNVPMFNNISCVNNVWSMQVIPNSRYSVVETKKKPAELELGAFIIEWRRCHGKCGDNHFYISAVIFWESHAGPGIENVVSAFLDNAN